MPAELTVDVDKPNVQTEQRSAVHAEVTIEPEQRGDTATRQTLLLVDVSNSMTTTMADGDTERIEAARKGAAMTVGQFDDWDHLGVMTFSSDTRNDVELTEVSRLDEEQVRETLHSVTSRGGTDLYGGLEAAGSMFDELPDEENAVSEILLLTDGEDNYKDAPEFESLATRLREEHGVSVVAAGVGEYDRATVRTIATSSGGRYDHVSSAADVMQFFGDEVVEAGTTVLSAPDLVVDEDRGVELVDAYRRRPQVQDPEVRRDGSTASVPLPKLLDEEIQEVVLKLTVPGRPAGEHTVAEISVEGEAMTDLSLVYTDDLSELRHTNRTPFLKMLDSQGRIELDHGNFAEASELQETMVEVGGDTHLADDLESDTIAVRESDDEEDQKASLDEAVTEVN